MKCRRSNTSRGARLRGKERPAAGAATPTAPPMRMAHATAAAEPATTAAPLPASSTVTAELRIDGRTEGAIQYSGTVTVGVHGSIRGGIRARVIVVEGEVTGDLQAEEMIRVAASGRVTGDLQAPRIAALRGAQIRGRMIMRRNAEQEAALDDFANSQVLAP